eukprot:gb/GFBE01044656.1/.p1 GENE.gb/GFBE01044656.1/~~gb/GFBE01044656.1/.p1  ORF type:complete len:518 (+),score=94.63 gb/GFBE01044656.1/:1-1554(+)
MAESHALDILDVELDGSTEASDETAAEGACGGGEDLTLRQTIGAGVALLAVVGFAASEASSSLSSQQHRTLGVLCLAVALWVSELLPIPITGMLVGPLLYLLEVCSLSEAIGPYMSNLTLVLFGSYFIAIAMSRHGLDSRFAEAITTSGAVKGIPWRLRLAMMFAGCTMSMWISNTGATNILTPIMLRSMNAVPNRRLSSGLAQQTLTGSLLSVAYACNAGGMGTLVGTPPNLVASRFLKEEGVDVGFVRWLGIGIPASLLVVSVCYAALFVCYRPRYVQLPSPAAEQCGRGRWTWGEKVVLGSFLLTVLLWLFPPIYSLAGGPGHVALKKKLPAGVAVLLGTLPMYVIRDKGRTRVLPWSAAKTADWGIIMLVGGGVVLGERMLSTGLADVLAENFTQATGISDIWLLTFLAIFFTIFATEVASNTATTSIMVPMVIATCKTIDPDPHKAVAPVLGVALAASCAFMMPIATPPNYIVKDTGHVELCEMAKVGFFVNLLCTGLLWLLLRALVPLIWP